MNKNYYYFLPLLLFILYYINYIQTDIITNNIVVSSDDINDDGDIIEGMDPASVAGSLLATHRLNAEGHARRRRGQGGRRARSHRRAKSSARLALRKDAARSRAQRIITAGGRRCPAGR